MGTGNHGGFGNTYGSRENEKRNADEGVRKRNIENETTATVWRHIKATAENYLGTSLPKSFSMDVPITKDNPSGKMWSHGNATEHMYEAISSSNEYPNIKSSNPDLYTQFILYDYYISVSNAVKNGVNYEKKVTSGNWEFVFSSPREKQKYPVIKHAKFKGLKEAQ